MGRGWLSPKWQKYNKTFFGMMNICQNITKVSHCVCNRSKTVLGEGIPITISDFVNVHIILYLGVNRRRKNKYRSNQIRTAHAYNSKIWDCFPILKEKTVIIGTGGRRGQNLGDSKPFPSKLLKVAHETHD